MDEASWLALTAALTAIGGAWTWWAWRHRGAAAAVRGAGLTLLAPAAYLTGTLELGGEIAGSVADWALGLVLSPVVWLGIVLAGLGALLYVVGGVLAARGVGTSTTGPSSGETGPGELPPARRAGRGEPLIDDDLGDIEEILRRRGIS